MSASPSGGIPGVRRRNRRRYVGGVATATALLYTAFVLANTAAVGPTTPVPIPGLQSWFYLQDALDVVAAGLLIAGGAVVLDRLLARDEALWLETVRLQASYDAQRRLLADTSHELRNPLTVLRTNLGFLLREDADPQTRLEAAQEADEEAARLARLVDDLLLLGRAEAGEALQVRPVALDRLLADVAEEAQDAGSDHQVTLEPHTGGPVHVQGDAERLRQVLRNVVGNALRHTPPGTRVRLSLTQRDGTVQIVVADDGPGIAPEHLPHVFDRFYRVDAARSRATAAEVGGSSGAGLGLAIAKQLVEAHGGTITVDSAPARGTTIRITLPAA